MSRSAKLVVVLPSGIKANHDSGSPPQFSPEREPVCIGLKLVVSV